MTDEMIEFNNFLTIRNHLGVVSQNDLLKMYQEYSHFLGFVDSIQSLIENDSGFLLFDDAFSDKIMSVFQLHRFDCEASVKTRINELIGIINRIKNYPQSLKNILKNNYLAYQEENRHISFGSTDSLLASISYDALVFTSLRLGNLDAIKDGDYYIMSLHYLMSTCPEFFQDELVYQRALYLIDATYSDTKRFSKRKKYVKEARERFLNLKEE